MKKTVFALLLLLLPLAGQAEDLYVKSLKGKVLSGPGFKNDVVTVLKKGDQVKVLERQKQWIKIQYQDKSGWISKLLLSPKPAMGKVSAIQEKETAQQKSSVRKRASAASTAAAARGLREDDRARLSDATQEDYQALEKMEKEKVNEKDVTKFSTELEK